jgi:prepilin-type N-terminal cleavage/methylation domain-containing protein
MILRPTGSWPVAELQLRKNSASRLLCTRGMTLVEIMCVTVVISLLVFLFLPTLGQSKRHTTDVKCRNNLNNVALAYRIWSTDGGDSFPFHISTNNGGTLELTNNVADQFRALSNELSTPKILLCPRDYLRLKEATNWSSLAPQNISFFAGIDSHEMYPSSILAGDTGFTVNGSQPKSGLFFLTNSDRIVYPQRLHTKKNTVNIALGDGSTSTIGPRDLPQLVGKTGFGTNRIILP